MELRKNYVKMENASLAQKCIYVFEARVYLCRRVTDLIYIRSSLIEERLDSGQLPGQRAPAWRSWRGGVNGGCRKATRAPDARANHPDLGSETELSPPAPPRRPAAFCDVIHKNRGFRAISQNPSVRSDRPPTWCRCIDHYCRTQTS